MADHQHKGAPWQVRIEAVNGGSQAAGILLDERHVLTCAHVVSQAGAQPGGPESHVVVSSTACRPKWRRTAQVPAEWWVQKEGTLRGDVALLKLDEAAPCEIRTRLWRTPLSGGLIRVSGFPAFAGGHQSSVVANLHVTASFDSEWNELIPVATNQTWIEKGFSGAGVMMLEGEFTDRVIGMVTHRYTSQDGHGAWMLPTEGIEEYLRRWISPFIAGAPVNRLRSSRTRGSHQVLEDALRLALTQELTRLLSSDWSGTVLVGTGDRSTQTVGDSWLVRLVETADPAVRAGAPDGELGTAPKDTVLTLGSLDAAYDASGASVDDVRGYLVERFGLPSGSNREVRDQLLRRTPPARLVIAGVDRVEEPAVLIRELLGPLAARAASRGIQLVLGFEDEPPHDLARQLYLDPRPLTGGAAAAARVDEAEETVRQLDAEEAAAARLHEEKGAMFFPPILLPPREAPRLRVRLAVARDRPGSPELAAIRTAGQAASNALLAYEATVRRRVTQRADLAADLGLYHARAARRFPEEDRQLGAHYTAAAEALHIEPIDVAAARRLVRRYIEEVVHREETGSGADEG